MSQLQCESYIQGMCFIALPPHSMCYTALERQTIKMSTFKISVLSGML